MDIARNDLSESFVERSRPESSRTHDQSTLYASPRLKPRSSWKSEREIVRHFVPPFEIASVERSLRSKTDISPNNEPGFSTASASSPLPGIVRLMRNMPTQCGGSRHGDPFLRERGALGEARSPPVRWQASEGPSSFAGWRATH